MQMTWLAKAMSSNLRKWLVSALLACLTIIAIYFFRMLPYSAVRVLVTDAMTMPGAIFAWIYVAMFGETSNWLATWARLAIFGNALSYLFLWRVLVGVYSAVAKRRNAGA